MFLGSWLTLWVSQADELNVKYQSAQSRAFPVIQTSWIENGGEQFLAIEELQMTEHHQKKEIKPTLKLRKSKK